MYTSEKNLRIVLSRSEIRRTLCSPLYHFLWNKRDTIVSLTKGLATMQGYGNRKQWSLELFLLEHKRHREKLKDSNTTSSLSTKNISFYSWFNQLTATQVGSRPGHCKGVIKDQAKAVCCAHCTYTLLLRRYLHSGLTHAWNLLETKVTV